MCNTFNKEYMAHNLRLCAKHPMSGVWHTISDCVPHIRFDGFGTQSEIVCQAAHMRCLALNLRLSAIHTVRGVWHHLGHSAPDPLYEHIHRLGASHMLRLRRRLGDRRELHLYAGDGYVPATTAELSSHFKIVPSTLQLRAFNIHVLPFVDGHFQLLPSMHPRCTYDLSVEGEREPRAKTPRASHIPPKSVDSPTTTRTLFKYEDPAMQERYDFLAFGTVPQRHLSDSWEVRASFKKNTKQRFSLSVDDGRLMAYKQNPNKFKSVAKGVYGLTHPLRLVLFDDKEAETIVRARHIRGHDRKNRMRAILTRHYKHAGMCAVIDSVLSTCNVCAEMSENIEIPTVAIMTQQPHELMMFDLFFMPYPTSEGYTCVLLVKDHFTKFLWAKALTGKFAAPIADYLFDLFVDGRPCPQRWHCDNGSEFVNTLMHEVIDLLMAKYTHGRPRHPQTQGSIERANGTVKRKLLAWIRATRPLDLTGDTIVDWADQLDEIVRNENDAPSKLYGIDPFFLQFNTPRALGEGGVHPTPTQVEAIRQHCIRCQEAYAGKINKFPEYDATFEIGDIVNVWASPKDRKDHKAQTTWSAKGVVEQNRGGYHNYYRVRWITSGLHTMHRHREDTAPRRRPTPGTLSMWIYRGHLRQVPTVPSGASDVFIDTDGNALFVLFRFEDSSFNYVFISGEYEAQEFLCTNDKDDLAASCYRVTYATWVHNTLEGLPLHTPYDDAAPRQSSAGKKRRHKDTDEKHSRLPKATALPGHTKTTPRTPAPAPPPAAAPGAPSKEPPRPCMYTGCRIWSDDAKNPMCPCPIRGCPQDGHLQCYLDYATRFCDTTTILNLGLPHTYMCVTHVQRIIDYDGTPAGPPAVEDRFSPPQPNKCAYGDECLHVDTDLNLCQDVDDGSAGGTLAHTLTPCDLETHRLEECTAVGHGNCFTHYVERTYTHNENSWMALREWGWAYFACPRCVDKTANALLRDAAASCKATHQGEDMLFPYFGFPMKPMDAPFPFTAWRRGDTRSIVDEIKNAGDDGTTHTSRTTHVPDTPSSTAWHTI